MEKFKAKWFDCGFVSNCDKTHNTELTIIIILF